MKREIGVQKRYVILVATLIGVVSFALGAITVYLYSDNNEDRLQQQYNLLAKRALIRNPNDVVLNVTSLRDTYNTYVTDNKLDGKVNVYFEYLPTGSSVGLNKTEQLAGASLLKTPLAINLYKASEEGKINLDTTVALKKEWLNDQYGDLYKKGVGYQLTLRQASDIMLRDSDNTAALAIYETLASVMPIESKLLSFLDADYTRQKDESIKISAESYSNILKCLYFACYTNKDDSQAILKSLTLASDSSRLKLYLPETAVVAHKIGTFDSTTSAGSHIQSDCGIFYVPNRNYLLCVMVEGDDPEASRIIGDLSLQTYKFITSK